MNTNSDLRILFPTNFSDACFQASRAVAQLADTCHVALTIAHVAQPGEVTIQTRRAMNSFMAEADHYDSCRRLLVESRDRVRAIADLCREGDYDLIVSPSADRLGLHRMFVPSMRAQLLKTCAAPLWTAGACLDRATFKQAIQRVACVIDFDNPGDEHVRLACALAMRLGAKLLVGAVISPIDEGALARSIDSRTPLMPELAKKAIRTAFDGVNCLEIDVAVGSRSRELPRMLNRWDADLAFLGPGQVLGGFWSPAVAAHVDRLPCPAICVDGAAARFNSWSFQRRAALPAEYSPARALAS